MKPNVFKRLWMRWQYGLVFAGACSGTPVWVYRRLDTYYKKRRTAGGTCVGWCELWRP